MLSAQEIISEIMQNLKVASEAAAQARQRDMDGHTVPRCSEIELYADAVAQQVSPSIHELLPQRAAEYPAPQAKCPIYNKMCGATIRHRKVQSIDGPVELSEAIGYCNRCDRSFFPNAII